MALIVCPECGQGISEKAMVCPKCGCPMREPPAKPPAPSPTPIPARRRAWGFEWRSKAEVLGWPLVHVAIGRDARTGKLRVAKGIIAVGQFGFGVITIAQVGVGLLFGFGQAVGGLFAVGQVALGYYFGAGQIATGLTVVGQFALGRYVLAQMGFGTHVWSTQLRDPVAIAHFTNLWEGLKGLFG